MSEAAPERRDVGPRAATRVLRSPNFGPYFFGNAASASGTWFQNLAATLALLGLGMIAFSLCPWLLVAVVPLFLAGFGYLASNTAATTRLQLGVRESQRGRIMALWSIAFLGLRPIASLADGALAAAFGVRVAGVVLALPAIACAGAIALTTRARVRA
jgi:hypothetical protein